MIGALGPHFALVTLLKLRFWLRFGLAAAGYQSLHDGDVITVELYGIKHAVLAAGLLNINPAAINTLRLTVEELVTISWIFLVLNHPNIASFTNLWLFNWLWCGHFGLIIALTERTQFIVVALANAAQSLLQVAHYILIHSLGRLMRLLDSALHLCHILLQAGAIDALHAIVAWQLLLIVKSHTLFRTI